MAPCPFCELLAEPASHGLLVLRTRNVFVFPAPVQRRLNRGHMLVLPALHITRLIDAEPSVVAELYTVAARIGMAARGAFHATGATLFQNDNAPDQVLFHLHIHVVPRRLGDSFRIPDPDKDELSIQERENQAVTLRRALDSA